MKTIEWVNDTEFNVDGVRPHAPELDDLSLDRLYTKRGLRSSQPIERILGALRECSAKNCALA